jgi:hypothetical protein
MRYTILRRAVSEHAEINRFFDHISKISHFRNMPLFWLQWHMAMCGQESWTKAEDYLKMGYTAADAYEKRYGRRFNTKQLDDRKAKFLVARADSISRSGDELFKDMNQALDILGRIVSDADITRHPYETLLDIVKLLQSKGSAMLNDQHAVLIRKQKMIAERAKVKLSAVPEGFQRRSANDCIQQIEVVIAI